LKKTKELEKSLSIYITSLYYLLNYDIVDLDQLEGLRYSNNNVIKEASKLFQLINTKLFSLDYELCYANLVENNRRNNENTTKLGYVNQRSFHLSKKMMKKDGSII
jgi:hypothetical protein